MQLFKSRGVTLLSSYSVSLIPAMLESIWPVSCSCNKYRPIGLFSFLILAKCHCLSNCRAVKTTKSSIYTKYFLCHQARSQACVSRVAKLSRRSHVVRNLRAYFTLYFLKIKGVMCVLRKLNFLVCHKNQGRGQSKCLEISPLLQRKSSKTDCKSNCSWG